MTGSEKVLVWGIHHIEQFNLGAEMGMAARGDFEYIELTQKSRLQKARGLFGKKSDTFDD